MVLTFGIIANSLKDPDNKYLKILTDAIELSKFKIVFCCDVKDLGEWNNTFSGTVCDCIFVLGGDGTILTAASFFAPKGIKIIPVNLGHIGYLSEITVFDVFSVLSLLKDGSFFIDRRILLKCSFQSDGDYCCALNDVVFSHKNVSRLSQFEVYVNDCFIDKYKCDGIIVSTPTGSTAYSLSAGGPVIAPYAHCLVITPICPHSLSSKVIVVSDRDTVSVKTVSDVETVCSCDGHDRFQLEKNNIYDVCSCDFFAEFIRFKDINFFEILKDKLND